MNRVKGAGYRRLSARMEERKMGDTVLLACSALEAYIDAAQARVGTAYPVVYVDKTHHEQPKEMRL